MPEEGGYECNTPFVEVQPGWQGYGVTSGYSSNYVWVVFAVAEPAVPVCGDGIVQAGEQCDPPGQREQCLTITGQQGYKECNENCLWTSCTAYACTPGETKCEGADIYVCNSDGMGWSKQETCDTACIEDAPGHASCAVCSPGEKRCNGMYLEVCNAYGTGWDKQYCEYGCAEGRCLTACENPNFKQCDPGEQQTRPCGKCGTQVRTCNDDCTWGDWGPCQGEGVCIPGTSEYCELNGIPGEKVCQDNCQWGVCVQTGECHPGETRTCGNCGTQTCDSTGHWGPCQNQGECTPGDTKICVSDQGCQHTIECLANCQWEDCPQDECVPGSTMECDVNGIPGIMTCSEQCTWGYCQQTGECVPGSTKSCGECGIQVCDYSGHWSPCQPQQNVCGEGYVCVEQ